MPLVVPGVVRFTVHGRYGNRDVANIYDVDINTRLGASRIDAINDLAGRLINAWTDEVLDWVASAYSARSVTWVDLDDDEGTTGERTSTLQHDWPIAGGNDTDAMPGNVSILIRKVTDGQRGSRNGRMYLVGVPEEATTAADPNQLFDAYVGSVNDYMQDLLTEIDGDHPLNIGSYDANSVVTHITSRDSAGNPATGIGHTITRLVCQQTLATQRRRLRS